MPDEIVSELADMFADTILWEQMGPSGPSGRPTPTGVSKVIPARISQRVQLVRDGAGNEVSSSQHATLAGHFGVDTNDKFTLPARFSPRVPKAIAVLPVSDENGPHHEVVYF